MNSLLGLHDVLNPKNFYTSPQEEYEDTPYELFDSYEGGIEEFISTIIEELGFINSEEPSYYFSSSFANYLSIPGVSDLIRQNKVFRTAISNVFDSAIKSYPDITAEELLEKKPDSKFFSHIVLNELKESKDPFLKILFDHYNSDDSVSGVLEVVEILSNKQASPVDTVIAWVRWKTLMYDSGGPLNGYFKYDTAKILLAVVSENRPDKKTIEAALMANSDLVTQLLAHYDDNPSVYG